jgi:hypothetical protein
MKGRRADLRDEHRHAAIRVVGKDADGGTVILDLAPDEPAVREAYGCAQKLRPASVERLDVGDRVGHRHSSEAGREKVKAADGTCSRGNEGEAAWNRMQRLYVRDEA